MLYTTVDYFPLLKIKFSLLTMHTTKEKRSILYITEDKMERRFDIDNLPGSEKILLEGTVSELPFSCDHCLKVHFSCTFVIEQYSSMLSIGSK